MALLRRDNSRGRGSSRNVQNTNRHSLADFLHLDNSLIAQPVVAPALSQGTHEFGGEATWRWNETNSPEAAQSPRALVPAGCFPPGNSTAFASYSESAQVGPRWREELNSNQIATLVTSLESMKLPSPSTSSVFGSGSQSISLSYDQLEKALQLEKPVENQPNRLWPPEQAGASAADNRACQLARRASFNGATSVGRIVRQDLVWNGVLPTRCADPAGGFSAKVFLGGLPWDIAEQTLMQTLKAFHPIRVEWPGRDNGGLSPRGYAYVTFENERRVRALLAASRSDGLNWYHRITSRKMRNKEVQVIPWAVSDSNWVSGGSVRLEPSRTVFVGALHGMITAAGLATIMNDLFAGVVYAGIDTDKNKYPIGSGRVTFNNVSSYVRAISAAFIEIRTAKFTKKVQIDPYLEDSMCSVCKLQQGPYFCREPTCFGYFCRTCWIWSHSNNGHRPLTRNSKSTLYQPHCHMQDQAALPSTPSPPATSGDSTNSAASGTSGPRMASEAEPTWPLQ